VIARQKYFALHFSPASSETKLGIGGTG